MNSTQQPQVELNIEYDQISKVQTSIQHLEICFRMLNIM